MSRAKRLPDVRRACFPTSKRRWGRKRPAKRMAYLPSRPPHPFLESGGKRNGAGAPAACLMEASALSFSLRFFRGREGREGRETPSFIGIASPLPSIQRSGRGRDLRAIARPNNKPPPLRSDPHCSADNASKATTVHSGKLYLSPET